jgi:N-acetylmuramoyl-L-alanine amidase
VNLVKRLLMFSVIVFFVVVGLSPRALALDYEEMQERKGDDISINKVWTIKFNNELDPDSINTDNIVVLNDKNEEVKIKVECKDSKTVSVSPLESYEEGKTYTLLIKDQVKSKDGNKIKTPIRMKFTINTTQTEKPGLPKVPVVVLDAGRAANDEAQEVGPSGIKGKDINLYVALKAGEILKANGIEVVYTRTTDSVPWSANESIAARSKIVNDAKANILVSIHCNAISTTAVGSQTYYLKGDTNSQKLASYIKDELYNKASQKGVIEESTLKTLSSVNATAVYTNLGYITNPKEEAILNSQAFKDNSAGAIASAVLKYLNISQKSYITDVPGKTILLYKNEKYTLPTSIDAKMSDGTVSKVTVKWDKTSVDTSKEGTYYYKGTVLNYNNEVTFKVIVNSKVDPGTSNAEIKTVNNINEKITEGDKYTLPQTVKAVTVSGETIQADVIWDKESIDTSKAGTITLTGRVKNYNKEITLTVVIAPKPVEKKIKIALDAGHGGPDSGAVGQNKTKEKDITLAVTFKIGDILKKNGIDVIYTRTNDTDSWLNDKNVELQTRVDIANNAKVDYFVSIHVNSFDNSSVTGVETCYFGGSAKSMALAQNIQKEIISEFGFKDRGIKDRNGLYVLKYTDAPATLVELEFISNPEREAMLKKPEYQQRYAEAIARGIMKTIGK